jgi:hypothetical protein
MWTLTISLLLLLVALAANLLLLMWVFSRLVIQTTVGITETLTAGLTTLVKPVLNPDPIRTPDQPTNFEDEQTGTYQDPEAFPPWAQGDWEPGPLRPS